MHRNPDLRGQGALESNTSFLPGTKFRRLTAVKHLTLKRPYKKTQVPLKAWPRCPLQTLREELGPKSPLHRECKGLGTGLL